MFVVFDPALVGAHGGADEAGGGSLFDGRIGQEVTRELLDGEDVEVSPRASSFSEDEGVDRRWRSPQSQTS
jgi:hypothetical protein